MQTYEELINSLTAELRRGTIIVSVLSQLQHKEYGYSLVHKLKEKGMNVDSDTLYPLLRRLEKQGILKSELEKIEERERKYYIKTEFGQKVYQELCSQWKAINASMQNLLGGEKE